MNYADAVMYYCRMSNPNICSAMPLMRNTQPKNMLCGVGSKSIKMGDANLTISNEGNRLQLAVTARPITFST